MNLIKNDSTIVRRYNRREGFSVSTKQTIDELQKKITVLENHIKSILSLKKLKVSTKGIVYFINFTDIMYLKSESNYTYLYLINNKKLLISKTLRFLVERINDPIFIRIHASYFINSRYLCQYLKSKDKVILERNIELPVSRSNKKVLAKWMDE